MWKLNKNAKNKKFDPAKKYISPSYSIRNKLRREGRSEEKFEIMLNQLDIEEIIALKLELSFRSTGGHRLYGLPLWRAMPIITKNALLKFALTACRTKNEMASVLGLTILELYHLLEVYKVKSFFEKGEEKDGKQACVSFGHKHLPE